MPRRVPYPELPKGKGSAAQRQRQRQWLSLLWSIESAAENGTHGLKGLTVALGRIIVARGLEYFVLNAEEHQKPLRTVKDLLWDERLPLTAAGQSMQDLVRKLPCTMSVEMNETAVFPAPWERWRFFKALGGLGAEGPWGPWRQEADNHYAVVWEPWPIVWVDNGNHSTMAALVRGGGRLKCKEAFDFTPVLEAVRTDGITWARAADGSKIGPVRSMPMAGIFLIGQRLAGIAGGPPPVITKFRKAPRQYWIDAGRQCRRTFSRWSQRCASPAWHSEAKPLLPAAPTTCLMPHRVPCPSFQPANPVKCYGEKLEVKLIRNAGTDRVLDLIQPQLTASARLDLLTPAASLFAYDALRDGATHLAGTRLLLPCETADLALLGTDADRPARNRLQAPRLARLMAEWLSDKAEVRRAPGAIPQGLAVVRGSDGTARQAVHGAFGLTTDGLGLTPGNPLSFIQASETQDEAGMLAQWFDAHWAALPDQPEAKTALLAQLNDLASTRDPMSIYTAVLYHLFQADSQDMDEDRIVKAATGIRNTVIWKKLYKFQRDGVIGAIDKLDRFGGCIIADSVGLGKTFEALAVIKYHELRNDRVLVLAPKRLRDNWTLYKANDQRNILASDRFNYDVLNHTDLSRDGGMSGDIDLTHINWGNYDLVVIDESHNFRNKKAPKQGVETRYDRLMRKIIREGVKTRVLMLSATPVNNRLADLKNQIAFATEGDDTALFDHGIASIDSTTRRAQKAFNRWLDLPEVEKTPQLLVEMLGFDYFSLLDHLTIARSRRHIEKYYGTAETGRFPSRLPPVNIKADVDTAGEFQSIKEINLEIRRLKLASYAPLRYVKEGRLAAYDEKYSTAIRGGESIFRQVDREESLIHLMRVNLLKRMESSVWSFGLTVGRQLKDVDATLAQLASYKAGSSGAEDEFEEIDIADVDIDDLAFEPLLVGRKVKVLLSDIDLARWRQDLTEDRNRLATMNAAAMQVNAARDDKLDKLRDLIVEKVHNPINAGNRKIIVFTAFADTAEYLYDHLAEWAKTQLKVEAALVTGSGRNRSTLPALRKDLSTILTAFSPRSKERPASLAAEGELDLLIATDCISEGQNLQDCDWLVNYDIHWNPVRIIQRFGRIDRIGSPNTSIQLVNFWPNMELEEYIGLEQRVSGRMVLLDISATGEENIIEQQSGDPMNDLEYRRKQLLKLQDAVIDLEDLSSGVSITDLTLTDFRIDLARYLKAHPGKLEAMPLGAFAVTTTHDADVPPGILFCLRAEGAAAAKAVDPGYPLAPFYLVHVCDQGAVLLPYTQAKHTLDRLKRLSMGRDLPDAGAVVRHAKATRQGEDMRHAQDLLAAAVASVAGKSEERAVASLFSPGGTHAMKGEFAGMNDFEVQAYLVVLPNQNTP